MTPILRSPSSVTTTNPVLETLPQEPQQNHTLLMRQFHWFRLITSTAADASYNVGDVIDIVVTFSEAVDVTGTPQLTLETGSVDRVTNYSSGSGTTTLTFQYTVQEGDTSADLQYAATSSLSAGNGTIKDGAGNSANLALPALNSGNSLAGAEALVIDTTVPVAISAVATDDIVNASEDGALAISGTSSGADGQTVTVGVVMELPPDVGTATVSGGGLMLLG